MIALNQTPNEYEIGVMRVCCLKERDGRRSFRVAVTLQCLDIGRICLDSKFSSEVKYEK